MHVLVTGSSGLVGKALLDALRKNAHSATALLRPQTHIPDDFKFGRVAWDPAKGEIDAESLHRLDAVVHLAGENIASGRWSDARKAEIRQSRVGSTRLLCEAIARLSPRPQTLVCASAGGYYGDRGQGIIAGPAGPGSGVLAEVSHELVAATGAAQ